MRKFRIGMLLAACVVAMLPDIGNLRRYGAIAIDVGDQDGLRFDARKLHEVLDSYGIRNSFTIYPGTHVSNVAFRFQDEALPFFSKHLTFEAAP